MREEILFSENKNLRRNGQLVLVFGLILFSVGLLNLRGTIIFAVFFLVGMFMVLAGITFWITGKGTSIVLTPESLRFGREIYPVSKIDLGFGIKKIEDVVDKRLADRYKYAIQMPAIPLRIPDTNNTIRVMGRGDSMDSLSDWTAARGRSLGQKTLIIKSKDPSDLGGISYLLIWAYKTNSLQKAFAKLS